MWRRILVLAALLAGPPVGAAPVRVRAEVARALAARNRPEVVLPEPAVTRIDRCAVAIGPLPDAARARAVAALQALVGPNWQIRRGGHDSLISEAFRWGPAPSPSRSIVPLSREDAIRKVVAFAAETHELFGLSAEDLLDAVAIAEWSEISLTSGRTVFLEGRLREPALEGLHTVSRDWSLEVVLDDRAQIVQVEARLEILPRFKLCAAPRLRPDDPAIARAVVGHPLVLDGVDAETVGPFAARDVEHILPAIVRLPPPAGAVVTLRRAYEVLVVHDDQRFRVVVDGDTAAVLSVSSGFGR